MKCNVAVSTLYRCYSCYTEPLNILSRTEVLIQVTLKVIDSLCPREISINNLHICLLISADNIIKIPVLEIRRLFSPAPYKKDPAPGFWERFL